MTPEKMKEILTKAGYAEYAELIESKAELCLSFELIPTDEAELPIGCSKAGGSPDLPLDRKWPTFKHRPLDFILQLNLNDLARYPFCHALPDHGILYVFYDATRQPWGFDPKDRYQWQILFAQAPGRNLERSAPDVGAVGRRFATCALRFYEALPPSWINIPMEELNLDEPESQLFLDFALSLPDLPAHQILGHPRGIQSSEEAMQFKCQCVSNGLCMGDSGGPPFDVVRANLLARSTGEWRLLLQIDSDAHAGMEWGDSGTLYFWIREEDLRQRNFSKVWMILQCH